MLGGVIFVIWILSVAALAGRVPPGANTLISSIVDDVPLATRVSKVDTAIRVSPTYTIEGALARSPFTAIFVTDTSPGQPPCRHCEGHLDSFRAAFETECQHHKNGGSTDSQYRLPLFAVLDKRYSPRGFEELQKTLPHVPIPVPSVVFALPTDPTEENLTPVDHPTDAQLQTVWARRRFVVFVPDEKMSGELVHFMRQYQGVDVVVVRDEAELRKRIFEGIGRDKMALVSWGKLSPSQEAALKRVAHDARVHLPFAAISHDIPEESLWTLQSRYNPEDHTMVSYVFDASAQQSRLGFRTVGFDFDPLSQVYSEEEQLRTFIHEVRAQRHLSMEPGTNADAGHGIQLKYTDKTLYEPIDCKQRSHVGDKVVVQMKAAAAGSRAGISKWGPPGQEVTIGDNHELGIPKAFHRAFLNMCPGMRRQATISRSTSPPLDSKSASQSLSKSPGGTKRTVRPEDGEREHDGDVVSNEPVHVKVNDSTGLEAEVIEIELLRFAGRAEGHSGVRSPLTEAVMQKLWMRWTNEDAAIERRDGT